MTHTRPTISSMAIGHPLDRSGLAARSDFETMEWRQLFERLEQDQNEFLARQGEFRSPEYKWPQDALHCWSRAWEYPYAYHHLSQLRDSESRDRLPRIVDVGSGVTFFPFSVARLGFHVTCADIDPLCARDVPQAARVIAHEPGKVDFRFIDGDSLPFTSSDIDAVYCVSVLEHIASFEQTVAEMARILRPGGMLVLTIDLDLRGDSAISVGRHKVLIAELEQYFDFYHRDRTIHPADVLDTSSGPYAPSTPVGLNRLWFQFKQRVKPLLGKEPSHLYPFLLAVQGLVMVKR